MYFKNLHALLLLLNTTFLKKNLTSSKLRNLEIAAEGHILHIGDLWSKFSPVNNNGMFQLLIWASMNIFFYLSKILENGWSNNNKREFVNSVDLLLLRFLVGNILPKWCCLIHMMLNRLVRKEMHTANVRKWKTIAIIYSEKHTKNKVFSPCCLTITIFILTKFINILLIVNIHFIWIFMFLSFILRLFLELK